MSKPIVISILANASQAQRTLNDTATATQRVGNGFRKAAVPATAALGLMAAGAKSLVDAASDAEQSIGATESVYKQYADTVIERSKKAASAIGISANEYRELANVTGAMLKNAGTPLKEVADLTDKLNTRAADLAATYGGSTKDAIQAVSSLLRGEADPIEKYGVSIKQSDIAARLAAKGLDKLTGGAKKQAEQQARLELLFKQTGDAAGQFDRESGTAANKAQKNAAKLADLRAELGQRLLPAYIKLQEYLAKVLKFLSKHPDAAEKVAVAAAGLAVAVLTVNAAMKVGNAAAAVYTVTQKLLGKSTDATTASLNKGRIGAGLAGAALIGLAQSGAVGDGGLKKVTTAAGAAAAGFAIAGPFGAVAGAGAVLLGVGTKSEESAARQQKFLKIQQQINGQAAALRDTLNEQSGAITLATEKTIAKNLADNGAFTAAQKLGLSFDTVTRAALGDADAKRQVTKATSDYLAKAAEAGRASGDMGQKFQDAVTEISPLTGSVDKFATELGEARTATRQTNKAIALMAENARDKATAMRNAGSDAGRGYRNGLRGWLDKIAEMGAKLAQAAIEAAQKAQDSSSPSKVTRGLGRDFGDGYADGISKSAKASMSAARATVSKTVKAAQQANVPLELLTSGRPGDLTVLAAKPTKTSGDTYNITVKLDSAMTEIEMGRAYQRAINAAKKVGAA